MILNPIARTCELQKPRGENSLIATNLRNVVHQFCEFGRLQLYQHHCPLHSTKGGLLFYAEAAAAVAVGGRPKTTPRLDRILGVGIPFILLLASEDKALPPFPRPIGIATVLSEAAAPPPKALYLPLYRPSETDPHCSKESDQKNRHNNYFYW